MEPRALVQLEFPKVLAALAGQAVSEAGAQACLDIAPIADLALLTKEQEYTRQCQSLVGETGFSLGSFPPLAGVFAYLGQAHKSLDADGFWAVRQVLDGAKALRENLGTSPGGERWGLLKEKALGVVLPQKLHPALKRCLAKDGGLRDEASPELFSVRQEIRSIHQRCTNHVKDFVAKQGLAAYLQDDFMTISSDRYVLPMKTNFKGRLSGIIHDYSQTGETCYFEPLFLVDLNNRLQELKKEEREEERKVLVFLTDLARSEEGELHGAYEFLVSMDVLVAKARLAGLMGANVPEVGADRELNLAAASHPLLVLAGGGVRAKPVDLTLKPGQRALIISGANAAGKTVALKTLGLMALMALSGLAVPAREGSRLPFWKQIFVFMGDEQSLEDHLSTFTAQISHLSRAWEVLGPDSLVLLDEFGAGTDPAQGAALAQAVVDKLLDRGAYLGAATHFPALKAYGLTKEGVRSASMLFDPKTKKPMFILAYDQVGASVALDVARDCGLPEEILEQAGKYLLQGGTDTARLFDRLNELALEREEELAELAKQRQKLEEKRLAMSARFEKERLKLLEDLRLQAKAILHQAEAEKISRKQALKELAETRKAAQDLASPAPSEEPAAPTPSWEDTAPGDRVRLKGWDREGLVKEKDEKRRSLKVDMGGVSLWATFEDITAALGAGVGQAPKAAGPVLPPDSGGPVQVLDIRGLRADEALSELAGFLDRALLRGFQELEVVHGRGTGALRREVHAFLKAYPGVAEFRLAPEDRGGDGMTMVSLK